ncbi:MAG: peptide-methionine (S)-S-oxide reductase MsrA [Candidatus Hydrogenedentes bacterium]|nr:peptide-methionine (S)-S-oxide reductase MsrA [Candidatus Hydrogenedentota bacterium]
MLTACHVQAAPADDTTAGAHLPAPAKDIALAAAPGEAIAVFAGGCFWCTEAVFEEMDGVKEVVSGYTGGDPQRADYKAVSTGATGHAESIRITYDPSKVTYGRLLRIFFGTHDPTTKDRQGPDAGTQYRSAIFTTSDEQKAVSEAYIQQLADAKAFSRPITTTMQPLDKFFPAEEYHQDFVKNNPDYPYVQRWAKPKLKKLEKLLEEERVNEE